MSHLLSNRVWRVATSWAAGLLPRQCFLCGGSANGTRLCSGCAAQLPEEPVAHCPVCALPSVDDMVCGRCQREPPAFDRTIAAHLYVFPFDRMVHALKYRGDLSLAAYFGGELAKLMLAPEYDLVVPMPLHAKRLRLRGFNQAVEIARPFAKMHRLHLDLGSVRRIRDTQPQADLPWLDRKANMRGAFACDIRLDEQRVLLIDDVMTTGASLDALALALKAAGAARVDNLVVARTPPPG